MSLHLKRNKNLGLTELVAIAVGGMVGGGIQYEGFTNKQAVYGVDNTGANWKKQAAKKAESYMEYSSFSRSGLIDQLEYEGFTHDQAVYGVDAVGLQE